MFEGILYTPTCTLVQSENVSFPTSYDLSMEWTQFGMTGFASGSGASFTNSVIHTEGFGLNCVSNGCSYSYSSTTMEAEYSNLQYYMSSDGSGYHLFDCQETSGESSC